MQKGYGYIYFNLIKSKKIKLYWIVIVRTLTKIQINEYKIQTWN